MNKAYALFSSYDIWEDDNWLPVEHLINLYATESLAYTALAQQLQNANDFRNGLGKQALLEHVMPRFNVVCMNILESV